jgi:hypothetical protein
VTYWFVYGPSVKYGAETSKYDGGQTRRALHVGAAISGLAPETTYHFRVVARSGEETASGRDRTFTTPPDTGNGEAGEWELQATPDPGGSRSILEAVSCVSRTACIAAGEANGPLAERWDGVAWSLMQTPLIWTEVEAVSCTSITACTVVGYSEGSTFAMRWDGVDWRVQETPNVVGASRTVLHGVSCVSETFCIAVGDYRNAVGYHPLAMIWDGFGWKIEEMPTPSGSSINYVYDVSCTSATACTAVGYTANGPIIERWNGTEWTEQMAPTGQNALDDVFCISATSCIAVGRTRSIAGTYAAIWDGTEWRALSPADPPESVRAQLRSISCVSANTCIAVGWFETEEGTGRSYPLAEIWDGSSWEIQPIASPPDSVASGLRDVSCVRRLTCEAVGGYNAGPIFGWAARYE